MGASRESLRGAGGLSRPGSGPRPSIFVDNELMPLEPAVLAREISGQPIYLSDQEEAWLLAR